MHEIQCMQKPVIGKNSEANDIIGQVHQVQGNMLCTNRVESNDLSKSDILGELVNNASWAVCITCCWILSSLSGAAILFEGKFYLI